MKVKYFSKLGFYLILIFNLCVGLSGFDLEEYRRKEREKNVASVLNEKDVDQSSESEEEELRKPGHIPNGRVRHDIVVRSDDKNSSMPNFFKSSKKNPTTFPYFEEKLKFDEYGEIIRPEDYVIADSEDLEMTEGKTKADWDEEMPVSRHSLFLSFSLF